MKKYLIIAHCAEFESPNNLNKFIKINNRLLLKGKLRYKLLYLFLFFVTLMHNSVHSQKYDYNWMYGWSDFLLPDKEHYKSYTIDHNVVPPVIKLEKKLDSIATWFTWNLSASDSLGDPIFCSDGFHLYNRNYKIMEGGDSINFSNLWSFFKSEFTVYLSYLSAQFIPYPGHPNMYLLFMTPFKEIQVNSLSNKSAMLPLMYCLVDMNQNNGLGRVIEKDVKMIDVPLVYFGLNKHANGRDWWLVTQEELTGRYFTYLIDPQGIHAPNIQLFEDKYAIPFNEAESRFSPDGTRYARNSRHGVILFDFDRCNGLLSKPIYIPAPIVFIRPPYLNFSPNSQLLYLNYYFQIYQLDLRFPKELHYRPLLKYNGYEDPFNTYFSNLILLPDNSFYSTVYCGCYTHAVIHQPDLPGLACDVQTDAYQYPYFPGLSLPMYPHYRLGAITGSSCDTIRFMNPTTTYNLTGLAADFKPITYTQEEWKIYADKVKNKKTGAEIIIENTLRDMKNFKLSQLNK